jgi:signal recognition particle subunit SRP54
MFEKLTDSFHGLFRKLSGQAEISEKNVADAMEDVRKALLDADVNQDVVNEFSAAVMKDAVGAQVTKSLSPGEEMIGIVHKRLIEFLGGNPSEKLRMPGEESQAIMKSSDGPTVVMMCGLQGSGKTTTCGKLAAFLKKRGRSVMLAAADLQRPAAIEQLETVANQVKNDMPGGATVTFYAEKDKSAEYGKAVGVAVDVCKRAYDSAKKQGVDVLILDTAGRLHINDSLMGELAGIKQFVPPHHVFLIVDSMTGQDALHSAKAFHAKLSVDGIILTKFDSDTRGGAALSVKHVTGAPIKFVGVGEKLDDLEEFQPQRIAGRILGMGDVLSLVEKAQEQVSAEDAENLQAKMVKGEMTMDDFLDNMRKLRRMGPMKQLMGLLPGLGSVLKDVDIDDGRLNHVEAMITSMTSAERAKPGVIDLPRRKRIAKGSGTKQEEIGNLVKQFDVMNKLTKQMGSMSAFDRVKAVQKMSVAGSLASIGGMQGAGNMLGMGRGGSSFTPSVKSKFKKRK